MLEVNGLNVSYGPRRVLHHIHLTAQPGQILGVIGPNGSGKTTLMRAISGVIAPDSGRVTVDGQDLLTLNEQERARRVAVVPQARNLPLAFTGWEMVQLGRTPYLSWMGRLSLRDQSRVQRALEQASALELAPRRLGDLSGGEQQRLLLARALAQDAPLLLMDEPTTFLDLQHQLGLLGEVQKVARAESLTVVMALHDINLVARFADRVALLVEGHLEALGPVEEVLDPELLSRVYHVPLQRIAGPNGGRPLILPTVL